MLDQLDQQLKITEDECKHYRESLEKLTEAEGRGESNEDLEKELCKVSLISQDYILPSSYQTQTRIFSEYQTSNMLHIIVFCLG